MPSERLSRISETHTRVPRMHGLPKQTDGSTEILTGVALCDVMIAPGGRCRDYPSTCPGYWQSAIRETAAWTLRVDADVDFHELPQKGLAEAGLDRVLSGLGGVNGALHSSLSTNGKAL